MARRAASRLAAGRLDGLGLRHAPGWRMLPLVVAAMAFLAARFSGETRHRRRLDKVLAIESGSMGGEGS